MDHPKFSVLSSSAICLWHSAKNYCDKWHTDGLIPTPEMRRFRFFAPKFLAELLASAGPKSDGSVYLPLLEAHPVGYKMHDYLDHNDCRDEVLARLKDAADAADLRKVGNKDRQAKYRADRKAKVASVVSVASSVTDVTRDTPRDSHSDITRTCSTPSVSVTEPVTESDPQTPSVSSERGVGKTTVSPLDVWLAQLQADYPRHRVSYGFMTSSTFFEIFQQDERPAQDVWAEMRSNLENQKAGHEWRVKGMVPKLEKWLLDGLWKQRHEAAPVATLVSDKTARTLSSAQQFIEAGKRGTP